MGYAGSLSVCAQPRRLAPIASLRMWTSWPRPSATRIGMTPSGRMSRACVCPGTGRVSSPWPRAWTRAMSAPATSRCTTLSPTPPGTPPQYCGVLGKQDNCQVAVSVSVANDAVSLPVAYQLYLPESWARDRRRRRAVGVPPAVAFQPKWQIALGQIQTLQAEGVPPAPVVADAGYGDTTALRDALTTAGVPYVVGVKQETTAWPPGEAPQPPKRWQGRGRPPTRVRRTATHTPQRLTQVAAALPATAWRTVTWREGTRGAMRSRFARVRVRPAHRDEQRAAPRPEEWLLIEWPRGAGEPTKYWLSTLPETTSIAELVRLAKLRWRIERDYQELKDELGLDHFEGRGWRG